MKVFYFQYTLPQHYPPLWRSARLFRGRGWDVRFYVPAFGAAEESDIFAGETGAQVRVLGRGTRSADKSAYLAYLAASFKIILQEKPDWIYLSDLYAAPLGIRRPRHTSAVYHEHDQYYHARPSAWMRLLQSLRGSVCRSADLVVVPNAVRADILREQTRVPPERCLCVWNCPLVSEVAPERKGSARPGLRVVYSGSIVPARLPEDTLESMPPGSELILTGSETLGSRGYVQRLVEKGARCGGGRSVIWKGWQSSREGLLDILRTADVGLSLLPSAAEDVNIRHMLGASNKPFDLLAAGTAPLVSDLPDWNATFVEPGYGLSCRPEDRRALREVFERFAAHPDRTRAMAERGRARILSEWNYENLFRPVLERMAGRSAPSQGAGVSV